MADYALINDGTGAVYYRPTSTVIPSDPRNRDWQAYQTWLAVPNTPDADIRTLAEAQDGAIVEITEQAERELQRWAPAEASKALGGHTWNILRDEAIAADADGTPTDAEYPFLAAMKGVHGSTLADEISHYKAIVDAYYADAKLVERKREETKVAIEAAGTVAAVDAIVDALTWPNRPQPSPAPRS